MNETDAIVVRLDGEDVWVRTAEARSACGACGQRDGCASADADTLLAGTGRSGHLLRLPNRIHAVPGDAVVVRMADGMVLRAVWLAYGLPLLCALGGALLARYAFRADMGALLGLLLGLVCGFVFTRRHGLEAARGEPILSIDFKHTL
ncbi:MAG: SoxR reducing system RseC family protein [Pseudomonadota bacterium]